MLIGQLYHMKNISKQWRALRLTVEGDETFGDEKRVIERY